MTTPTFSTTAADTLIALADSDGPTGSSQSITSSGTGLARTRVAQANAQHGDAEIWAATATGALTNVTVSATDSVTGYHQTLTVVALKGATGVGAAANASNPNGAPTVKLTTTAAQSLVFATGNDWDSATTRTLPVGQTMLHEFSDTATGDDDWAQRTTVPTGAAGTQVTMNATAPTTDKWNLAAVEIKPATVSIPTTTYTYDSLDRLTAATEKTGTTTTGAWSYAYDKDGNRTSSTTNPTGSSATTLAQGYNAIEEMTTLNASATGLSYDADGNETANPGNGAAVTPRTSETLNSRDQITQITNGSTGFAFGYQGEGQTERNSAGSSTFTNTLLGLASQTNSVTTEFIRTPDGTLIGEHTTSGGTGYYLSDNQGSITGIVNNTQALTGTYTYDPYGQTRTRTATGTDATNNPYRYTAGYTDTTTGLIKQGARYYDPNIGRFTQTDPSGQETNPYAYTTNNPINHTDPTGFGIFSDLDGAVSVGLSFLDAATSDVSPLGSLLILNGVATEFYSGHQATCGNDDSPEDACDENSVYSGY